ncbi:MAG TPA: hypothetical protein ENL39_02660 [Candidatus Aerophobetes bacterium]|uniref:Dienelactone hydrolase domain-containing protein n=1 Tax=Aerophobetes bacterium TaxID=2030807 RepID=A0A7V5LZA8_UNCAE|nr:hypothetical protein [Candidatus Aerophobetes bacterium]
MVKEVFYKGCKREVRAFLCFPQGKTSLPGIAVFHGAEGLKDHHVDFGKELAERGYIVLVPEWFEKKEERFLFEEEDILGGIRYLKSSNFAKEESLAVVGFSLGAAVSLAVLSKWSQKIKALVLYYPPGWERIRNFFKDKIEEDLLKEAPENILILQGEKDRLVPPEEVKNLYEKIKKYGKNCKLELYSDADHAFNFADRKEYNKEAAEKAFSEVLGFLDRCLKNKISCL